MTLQKAHLKVMVKETVFRKWSKHFETVFGVKLDQFYTVERGFMIVAFEDWLMTQQARKQGKSIDVMYELVLELYGNDGAGIVEQILNDELKGLYYGNQQGE